MAIEINVERLKLIVAESSNLTEVMRKLGYHNTGAKHSRDRVKKIMENNDIDYTHFDQFHNRKNISHNITYSMEEILVENSTYYNGATLKKRLVKEGYLEYKCAICGNLGEWNGKKLVLQLDHKNGIHNDNRIYNLRFLCPNCHSQTDTFCGKRVY